MTTEEKEIMGDMFYFLRDHSDSPPIGAEILPYWQKTAMDISDLVDMKWRSHPLAMALGMALYGYLEQRAKAVVGDAR